MTGPASDELIERLSIDVGGVTPAASSVETAALIARIRQQDAEIKRLHDNIAFQNKAYSSIRGEHSREIGRFKSLLRSKDADITRLKSLLGPLAEFAVRRRFGERVTKVRGSQWTGHVVGFYSTELTPIGYAVESETEHGSVQIYPEAALKGGEA